MGDGDHEFLIKFHQHLMIKISDDKYTFVFLDDASV